MNEKKSRFIEKRLLLEAMTRDPRVRGDLEEEYDPALKYVDGSNADGASWDLDDLRACGDHLGAVPVGIA